MNAMTGRPPLLSDEQRAKLLRLRKTEHLSYNELADRFGLTPEQVSSQIWREENPEKYAEQAARRKKRKKVVRVSKFDNKRGASLMETMPPEQYLAWRKAGRPGFDGLTFNYAKIQRWIKTGEQ